MNLRSILNRLGFFSHNFLFTFKIINFKFVIKETEDYSFLIDGQYFSNLLKTEKRRKKRLRKLLKRQKNSKFDSKKLKTLVSPDESENQSSNRSLSKVKTPFFDKDIKIFTERKKKKKNYSVFKIVENSEEKIKLNLRKDKQLFKSLLKNRSEKSLEGTTPFDNMESK